MTTLYATINDKAAAPTQNPVDVSDDIDNVLGVNGVPFGSSGDIAGTDVMPMLNGAGALGVIDDGFYVDAGDGTLGTDSAFFPGTGDALGYQNEYTAKQGIVTEGPNYRTKLEPVGTTPDIRTVMGLA